MSQAVRTIEELVEEFLVRRRSGEPVEATSFAALHPALQSELRDALEAAEVMEDARQDSTTFREHQPEDRIGSFRLVREVGRGGMGVVFEAIEEPLDRRVALKLLPPDQLVSRSARARFRREAELASRLDHSGICTVYAAGVESDRPWIAMRFVEGATLARRVADARERGERRLGLPDEGASARTLALSVAACFTRVARALAYAHGGGVVHRDVKPANVMVTPSGEPILLDFGLAREEESDAPSLTRTGETTGTPAYIAPELLAGEIARPDSRCDVYALGVSLYECLALRQPFRAPTRAALYRAILAGAAPGLRALVPELPRDLAVVVATAMERDRARRYASAADLAADLEACVAGHPIAARPVSGIGRLSRWARREPQMASLAALLATASLGLALAGGAVLASRDEVRAAEQHEREEEAERCVVAGFSDLAEGFDGMHEEAAAQFARARALDPANAEAVAGAVLVSLFGGSEADAIVHLETAPPLRVFDRLRLVAEGESPELDANWMSQAPAIELFVEGLRFQLASEMIPGASPARRRMASRMALEMLDEAVARAPAARGAYHIMRAFAAADAGDEQAARSAAGALLTLWPDSYQELFVAGKTLVTIEPERARQILERVIALHPDEVGTLHNLATAELLSGRAADAERRFRRADELAPDNPDILNGLGLALADLDRAEEAREAYHHAIHLAPDFVEALANLGALELRSGDPLAAVDVLARAMEVDPENLGVREGLATALHQLGELGRAREQYEFVLANEPAFLQSWVGLSRLLLDSGAPEEALDVAERGLALHPDHEPLREVWSLARSALGLED